MDALERKETHQKPLLSHVLLITFETNDAVSDQHAGQLAEMPEIKPTLLAVLHLCQ
jgi:hypothetical protein